MKTFKAILAWVIILTIAVALALFVGMADSLPMPYLVGVAVLMWLVLLFTVVGERKEREIFRINISVKDVADTADAALGAVKMAQDLNRARRDHRIYDQDEEGKK